MRQTGGADVISMSLGGAPFSQVEQEAVNYAYNKGCVIVASSGNDSSGEVSYPAGYDNVIAVGATDENDELAAFSNYGEKLDIVAPGVEIYSTVRGGYGEKSGTSMACPVIAGMASVVISAWKKGDNPNWTPLQVENIILSNCDDVNSNTNPNWDTYMGYGRINGAKIIDFIKTGIVNVDEKDVIVYPNPFNPDFQNVQIVFPKNSIGEVKKLRVYSIDGQQVRELSGSGGMIAWDGKNNEGEACATGLYFYYLDTTDGSEKA